MSYIICTTQRSGKTWLCKTLECLRVGKPEEHLLSLFVDHDNPFKTAFAEGGLPGFCQQLIQTQPEPAGIAVQWNQLVKTARTTDAKRRKTFIQLRNRLEEAKVIYLKREDVLGQAISLFLKSASGYTRSSDSRNLKSRRDDVELDAEELAKCYRFTAGAYQKWEKLLGSLPFEYRMLTYERLRADTVGEIRSLLEYIGESRSDQQIAECSGVLRKIGDANDDRIRALAEADEKFLSLIAGWR